MLPLLIALFAPFAHAQQAAGTQLDFGASSAVPEYYVVQPGDTLWEVSSTFLGNPYYWPELWSINQQVTNPHWIYPGNRIVFRMGTVIEPPQAELEGQGRDGFVVDGLSYDEAPAECGPDVRYDYALESSQYTAPAFLAEDGDVEVYGTIAKSPMQGTFLGSGDLVYLQVDDPDAFDCGDAVSVFRVEQKNVKHPTEKGEKLGSLYRVVGDAVVVHRTGEWLTAELRTVYSEVSRGDLVGPVLPVSVELEVGVPEGDVRGKIVARAAGERWLIGDGEVVFIDRGREDGVRVGNSFYIIQQRDERDDKVDDEEMPERVIGRLVVVRVDDRHATGVIVNAQKEIPMGATMTQFVN